MMLKKFMGSYANTIYVQIWEQRIKVANITTGAVFDEKPLITVETNDKNEKAITAIGNNASLAVGSNIETINPFSHPRTLLSDFMLGEKILQHIFVVLSAKRLFILSPKVVIHPMEKMEGGLTTIEERAFKELAFGAGARDVVVYLGTPLPTQGFNFDSIKSR